RPAFHVGQRDIESDRVGVIGLGELNGCLTASGNDSAEALVARHLEQDLREVDVVLDDHHHTVALLDLVAIVGELLFDDDLVNVAPALSRRRPAKSPPYVSSLDDLRLPLILTLRRHDAAPRQT